MALSDEEVYLYYSTIQSDRLRKLREAFAYELQFVTGTDSYRFCQRRIASIDKVLASRQEVMQ